jgi:hypothetical protein
MANITPDDAPILPRRTNQMPDVVFGRDRGSTAMTNLQPAPALSQSAATGSPIQKDGAMAGIARNVELYNLAYKLAWKYISEDQKRNQPNIARHLDVSIRRQLKEGTTEAIFIASEALKDVETS